jgi:hypothetical protein
VHIFSENYVVEYFESSNTVDKRMAKIFFNKLLFLANLSRTLPLGLRFINLLYALSNRGNSDKFLGNALDGLLLMALSRDFYRFDYRPCRSQKNACKQFIAFPGEHA